MHNYLFLFFYHKHDNITKKCYEKLCEIEGEYNVQAVSNNLDYLPNTFCIHKSPPLFIHGDDYWMYDGLIYKYVLHNKNLIASKDAIFTLEYDTWWNYPSKEWAPHFLQIFDVLGPKIKRVNDDPNWSFFNRETTFKTHLLCEQLLAIWPLAVTCSKPKFLLEASELVQNNPSFHTMVNCELRFGTVMNIIDAKIGEFPFHNNIKWHKWNMGYVKNKKSVFHPIKDIDLIQ